jgi:putative acyl-CoA dehydrogenase
VEFYDACGWLVGDEGDGVRQILRMGGLTRFDCALGSHALMRRAFSVALYHALQRQAFGKNLVDQPMMRQLLGQMALRLEGQTAFLFRLARAWDRRDDARESAWARLFTPAAKFAICKAGIPFVAEAMEVLGGIGYCEESELPRLYREMPVNSIWEGSGNIMCLDVMRVLSKQPAAMELLAAECAEVKGQNRHLDRAWRQLQQLLKRPAEEQGREIARLVYRLGAGAQMLRHASPPLAEAWCRMMLDTRGGMRLDAPTLDDLLLRAMGRGRQAPQA